VRELGAVIVIANRGGMRNKKTTWHLFHKISILSIIVLFPVIRCKELAGSDTSHLFGSTRLTTTSL
jgi:hypothetical protein